MGGDREGKTRFEVNGNKYEFERRRFLKTVSTFAAGGGVAFSMKHNSPLEPEDVEAAEIESFTITDTEATTADGTVDSVTITVENLEIDYSNFSDDLADRFEVELFSESEEVNVSEFDVDVDTASVEETPHDTVSPDQIVGETYDLVQDFEEGFEPEDFEVPDGETDSFNIDVRLVIETLDDDGNQIDELDVLDETRTFTLTVTNEDADVDVSMDVSTDAEGDL